MYTQTNFKKMQYQIAWYDGFGGKPDYSKQVFNTYSEATDAAEYAIERHGCDTAYSVVDSKSHRRQTEPCCKRCGVDTGNIGEVEKDLCNLCALSRGGCRRIAVR